MKVKELIEFLENQNQDDNVVTYIGDSVSASGSCGSFGTSFYDGGGLELRQYANVSGSLSREHSMGAGNMKEFYIGITNADTFFSINLDNPKLENTKSKLRITRKLPVFI